jgi:UDP-glucose:(heptosyl)LPS alpha-1,3-glucosyltransferase
LESRVVFAGPSGEVERYYAAADAFLLPTPYDPFALVATEAMASGLAVVVSRAAGASELINDGQNGFVLEDVTGFQELAGHMNTLYNDAPLRLRLGKAARATMEQRSWDHVASETMEVYEQWLRSA